MARRQMHRKMRRQGSVLILTLIFMVVLLGMVAFAIDTGYLVMARTELQRSADAAAISAAWELIDEDALYGDSSMGEPIASARATAVQYAAANSVCGQSPAVDANEDNEQDGDVVLGTISEFSNPNASMSYDDESQYNAVKVRVRRTSVRNGNVPFFFGQIFGVNDGPAEAEATAGFLKQAMGFKHPGDGNLGILPFALDEDTWNDLQNDLIVDDDWSWDPQAGGVTSGDDGIREVNLYPQDTGSQANRGTVNIGGSNNSTSRVARQVTAGLTAADLAYHGGELRFNDSGEMTLGADPGISAGFQDELASIIGQPRIMPIFSEMSGNGNNGVYTIVKFVGCRVLDVDLNGNDKRVIIQPAVVITKGLVPPSEGQTAGEGMQYIYSPPYLIK